MKRCHEDQAGWNLRGTSGILELKVSGGGCQIGRVGYGGRRGVRETISEAFELHQPLIDII